jgi:hypothetical protein
MGLRSLFPDQGLIMNITAPLLWVALLVILQITGAVVSASEHPITLGTQKPIESPAGRYLNLVYTEAFKRLGRPFVYQTYPAKRSSILSDSGELDGELSRIDTYNEVHPNLMRIEEPHWESGFIAVATNGSIQLEGWDSLKGTDYKVLYMAGIKGCEINLPRVLTPQQLEVVMHTTHGFRMLLIGRADLFIGSEMDMLDILETDEFKQSNLKIVGTLERFTGHAFLHKKHQALVPELSAVLKQMKQQGLLEQFRKDSKLISYLTE